MRDFSKIQGRADRKYPMSNTAQARKYIRDYMLSYYADHDEGITPFEGMIRDAEASTNPNEKLSDWQKGKHLHNVGNFDIYSGDTRDFLKGIYVPEDVDKWDNDKVWERAGNLIGREYARMKAEYDKKKGK